jgi:hypothetical protein
MVIRLVKKHFQVVLNLMAYNLTINKELVVIPRQLGLTPEVEMSDRDDYPYRAIIGGKTLLFNAEGEISA